MENPIVLKVNCINDFMNIRPESLLIDLKPDLTQRIMDLHKIVLDNTLGAVKVDFNEGRWSTVELEDDQGDLIDNAIDLILYEPAFDVGSVKMVVRREGFQFQATLSEHRTDLILSSDTIGISNDSVPQAC